MMAMPRCVPRASIRGDWRLSWTHARTVLLLVVVGRVAWGTGEPDLNRRIGSRLIGHRRTVPAALHRSCMDLLNSTVPELDGFFSIDPDGPSGAPEFQVYCRLNPAHDHPGTTVVHTSDINSAVEGNLSVTIIYERNTEKDSIRALIDISDRCRQHLKYECRSAPIWLNGVQQVAWMSWDGILMPNWAGVATGNGRCACSLNSSCAGSGNCNCDVRSPPGYYVDSGYITDKDTLPVMGMDFNYHEGQFEYATYTVGPLECFGRATTKPSTTETTSTQEPTTIPTTEVTSTQEPSTTPTQSITTDRATTAEPTTRPEPPTTTEQPMTSVNAQPVTTPLTTTSYMTSIADVLHVTIPTISEVASAGQSSTKESGTSSIDANPSKSDPNPSKSDPNPTKSDLNVVVSEIEDFFDKRLEMFDVLPGNTPIESLSNVSKDFLDKAFGHDLLQDNPAIITEMAVTTLLEKNLAKIVGGLRHNETLQVTVDNTMVEAKSFPTTEDFRGYVFKAGHSEKSADAEEDDVDANEATLEISTGSTEDINGSFSVLVVFRDISQTPYVANLVEDEGSNGTSYVDSGILTCSVLAQGEPLEIALKLSLRHKPYSSDGGKTVHRLCSFWNNSEQVWSTKGCKTEAPDPTSSITTCSCNHNTSFAILLRVTDSPIPQRANADDGTTLLSIILGSLSILCLCMGLALYTYLRLFKFLQIKVHANLMGSLLVGQILFLTGINATENRVVCKIVTVLVQFFFSGTFCWMLVEGGLLFQRAKMLSMQQPKMRILMLIGWGVPFLITMISFAIGFEDYGTDSSVCWLSAKRGQIWAFVFLVIIVILVNLGIIVLVLRTFMSLKMNTDKDSADKIRASFRAMVVLVPILGLTWVFGFLQSTSSVFDYLFVIFNSSQGMLIFICHVLMNCEVQKAFKRRGKNKVSATTTSSCEQSHTQMTSQKTNTTTATAF